MVQVYGLLGHLRVLRLLIDRDALAVQVISRLRLHPFGLALESRALGPGDFLGRGRDRLGHRPATEVVY